MSTVLLLAQAPYQEPIPFLGEFVKRILALIVPAQHRFISELCTSVPDSSLSSDVSPRLEEFVLVIYLLHSNCCHSVNSTLSTLHVIICKHLAYEVMHYTLSDCSFCSVLACRWFILYVAGLCVCVCVCVSVCLCVCTRLTVISLTMLISWKIFCLPLILWPCRWVWAGLFSR